MKIPAFYTQEELKAAEVVFDTAIPQSIFNALAEAFPDQKVCGQFVIVYRPNMMMGFIQPMTI